MDLKQTMATVKAALESLEVKATQGNCRNLNTCHYLLDKVIETCDEIKKEEVEAE